MIEIIFAKRWKICSNNSSKNHFGVYSSTNEIMCCDERINGERVNYKQAYDNHTPSSENVYIITTSTFCHFYGSWKCTFEMYSTLKHPNNPGKENL